MKAFGRSVLAGLAILLVASPVHAHYCVRSSSINGTTECEEGALELPLQLARLQKANQPKECDYTVNEACRGTEKACLASICIDGEVSVQHYCYDSLEACRKARGGLLGLRPPARKLDAPLTNIPGWP